MLSYEVDTKIDYTSCSPHSYTECMKSSSKRAGEFVPLQENELRGRPNQFQRHTFY